MCAPSIFKFFNLFFCRDNAIKLDAMDRNTFREFLHDAFNMTDDILMDRIFKFFDTKSDGTITREEWILGLNVLLKGTTEEQTTYSFSIYDLNHDGFISKYSAELYFYFVFDNEQLIKGCC